MTRLIHDCFPAGITSGSPERDQQIYVDFVAKYLGDPSFRAWADVDTAAALRAEGLQVPEGVDVELLPSASNVMHVVLPAPSDE